MQQPNQMSRVGLSIAQVQKLWSDLDSLNILGWSGFLQDTNAQVCLAWLIYECVFWGRLALHTLNLILNNSSFSLSRTQVRT